MHAKAIANGSRNADESARDIIVREGFRRENALPDIRRQALVCAGGEHV
jgi:hypothetical protein